MTEEYNIIENYKSNGYKFIGKDKIKEEDEDYWYPAYDIIYSKKVLEIVSISHNGYFLFFWKEDRSNYCLICDNELIIDGRNFKCEDCESIINIREYFKQKFKKR